MNTNRHESPEPPQVCSIQRMIRRLVGWLNRITSPEGCTAVDAQKLREFNHGLALENARLREVLAGSINSTSLLVEVMRGNITEEWAVEIERLRAVAGGEKAPNAPHEPNGAKTQD